MNLKELEKLAKLCRKYGISSIEDNGLKLSFSDHMPAPRLSKAKGDAKEIEEDKSNEEDILFWSAAGPVSAS